jgi:hypothetical protein
MADTAADLGERVGLEGRYLDGLGDDQDADLASALASLVPEGSDLSPVHPEDLLSVISVFLAQATKQAEAAPGGLPALHQALVHPCSASAVVVEC